MRRMRSKPLPPSALELAKFLKDAPLTKRQALLKRVHRTQLWRYKKGKALPDRERSVLIESLTDGLVTVLGWSCAKAPKRIRGAA